MRITALGVKCVFSQSDTILQSPVILILQWREILAPEEKPGNRKGNLRLIASRVRQELDNRFADTVGIRRTSLTLAIAINNATSKAPQIFT